jgi:hypothetical protein
MSEFRELSQLPRITPIGIGSGRIAGWVHGALIAHCQTGLVGSSTTRAWALGGFAAAAGLAAPLLVPPEHLRWLPSQDCSGCRTIRDARLRFGAGASSASLIIPTSRSER